MNKKGKLTKRELKSCLDRLTKANNLAHVLRDKISQHSHEVYGYDPADIDCENFNDGADGAMGGSEGMTVDEFHNEMIDSMKLKGLDTDSIDWK
jgi:hypothetical protein